MYVTKGFCTRTIKKVISFCNHLIENLIKH